MGKFNVKILILVIIVVVSAGGGVYWWQKSASNKEAPAFSNWQDVEIPAIGPLSFDILPELTLTDFKLIDDFGGDLFAEVSFDTSLGGYQQEIDLSTPSVNIETGSLNWQSNSSNVPDSDKQQSQTDNNLKNDDNSTPPTSWQPDAATCSQFNSAPSCSYVPVQYQNLCQQCKDAGY